MPRLIVALIKAYQYALTPLLGPCCRFRPSCSAYDAEAVTRHGVGRGLWLSIKRIARCNPWNRGGYDPVP